MTHPIHVTLCGTYVRLEPLGVHHAAGLYAIGQDERVWRYLTREPFGCVDDAQEWIHEALEGLQTGSQLPFAIIHLASNRVAGTTRYLNSTPTDGGLEIGWTWLGVDYQRTPVNTECKWLLLSHAFESLGCVRVQLKTDLLNEASQRAIERIGGRREGVLRKFQRTRGGRIRDTVMYSILDDEWPAVRAKLERLLQAAE
jgi:RimJ/RimL family protein N-acetyltransferase